MDTRTKANSIRTLTRLRDVYQGQLDTSVINEIDEVIHALKAPPEPTLFNSGIELSDRVLRLISGVLQLVTNITDLMH